MKPEQLTAWALNELSDEEKAQIESLLQEDNNVQTQAAQTKSFCDFLSTELSQDSLALTPEERERLWSADAPSASQPKPQTVSAPAKKNPFWRRHALVNLAAAAAVVLGSTLLLRHEAEKTAQREDSLATRPAAAPKLQAEAAAMPAPAMKPDSLVVLNKLGTGSLTIQSGGTLADINPSGAGTMNMASAPASAPLGGLGKDKSDSFPTTLSGTATYSGSTTLPTIHASEQMTGDAARQRSDAYANSTPGSAATMLNGSSPPPPSASSSTLTLTGNITASGSLSVPARRGGNLILQGGASEELSIESKNNAPPTPGLAFADAATAPPAPAAPYADGFVDLNQPQIARKPDATPYSDSFNGRSDLRPNLRTNESYTQIIENVLKDVLREPLSTFSIDVDTAAYANVRRFLNQNSAPPRDAVRIEELINYFPTDEEGPAPGAKEPFAVKVEMAACPWQPQHRLARIAIKGRQIGQDRQPSNLVFLVDVSGSMGEPNKLPLVQQSLRMLTEQLGENDRVSMVTYADGTQVVLPSTSGQNKAEIMASIDRLQSGGSTHGSAGIRLAYEQAVAGFIKGGVNRVILCSDGDFNVGISSPEELETYITEKARSGVFLSLLGYGSGNLKDRTMETLADKGNGNYAYIDSLSEARKVLVEQMNGTLVTIAKDVKIQVEFNPAVIRSYRLIGYENRLLAKEDFNDDTKDAGEIGAGHSVTALYELVPANLPPGANPRPRVDDLKYQQPSAASAAPPATVTAAAAESGEALTVKLRYKEPEGSVSSLIEVPLRQDDRSLETASREFKFTTAVAGFGLLLRQSSYSGQLTWEQVRRLALEGKGTDPLGYRGEFIQLIEKARGLTR
ncbi:VWA domain-containing protein [Prosthecobacter sp. SYSU 5D2]|uniref:vWA domain-containing protein n=1 Tax=Prosthecobacter sp. SYSU 5D2 TaxID=3134134 RepID=UPI0031FE7844